MQKLVSEKRNIRFDNIFHVPIDYEMRKKQYFCMLI